MQSVYNDVPPRRYDLDMQVIADELEAMRVEHSFHSCGESAALESVRFFRKGEKLDSRYVYLLSAPDLSLDLRACEGIHFIAMGEADLDNFSFTSSVISILSQSDPHAVYNTLQQIFEKFAAWDSALQKAQAQYDARRTESEREEAAARQLTELLRGAEPEDAAQAEQEQRELTDRREALLRTRRERYARLSANRQSLARLEETSAALAPLLEKRQWLSALSETANGTLTGKEKIALETYVQTAFFERILGRANQRFLFMSAGQYELARRTEAENNRSQSGLELDVVDHYNDTRRSVKSLSGGESFMASLSLALGLSDEIQSVSGGVRVDAMFVDEGFGTLDESALHQAIGALQRLTQGGRLVGIISHVDALKDCVEKQILVTKDRTGGSRVRVEA